MLQSVESPRVGHDWVTEQQHIYSMFFDPFIVDHLHFSLLATSKMSHFSWYVSVPMSSDFPTSIPVAD